MRSGGQIQWNAIAICEMSKTSWQTGKLLMKEDLGNHSKDQLFHSEHQWNTFQTQRESKHEFINFVRMYYQGFFQGYALIAGRLCKGDILIADIEEFENLDASDICPRRLNAKEVLVTQKNGEFVFPVADGSTKLLGRDYEFQEPIPRREQTVRSESLSGDSHGEMEESTDRIKRCRRNPKRFLLYPR